MGLSPEGRAVRHVVLLEERTADGAARLTLGVDDGHEAPAPAHVSRGGAQLGTGDAQRTGDDQLAALDLHALPHG